MAGHSIRTILVAIAIAIAAPASARDAPPIHYDIAVHADGVVDVRASTTIDDTGSLALAAPWPGADDIRVDRGRVDTSAPGRWVVHAAPGDVVTLTWRPRRSTHPDTIGYDTWQSVLVRSDAVVAAGQSIFALPEDVEARKATVRWSVPTDWRVSTTLIQGTQSMRQVRLSGFMAGTRVVTETRELTGATLRVSSLDTSRGDTAATADAVAAAVTRIVPPKRRHDITVNLVGMNDAFAALSTSALPRGAMSYRTRSMSPGVERARLVLAAVQDDDPDIDAATAWYTQGFAAWRAMTMIRPLIEPADLARMLDETTVRYGDSPFRRVPNARVAAEFGTSPDLRRMAAARGELFASLLDARIREATSGTASLQDALARMPDDPDDPGAALMQAVTAVGGGDIGPVYRRYIVDGELLQLPRNAYGACFSVGTVADWSGWQTQHVFAKAGCEAPPSPTLVSTGT
ncbi:Predicted metalloprotease, contains C-terminal PDZ domain [Luteibacter sp. UNCMF331Sha3.1]|uniref:hypothetical protein n=1 Tax=Luteibacter sp. UNCMF331Sha3.1 TaxID=1502760 RepID=UPI0008AB693F|nr:hypothetical protein [Luteibacter sp. UNCMF331Sha3.1]SEM80568.1 Predicted metalloprotease, contains C-terminal PDZ domain [Luteibacter sp. UNCMF331Sha3.1]